MTHPPQTAPDTGVLTTLIGAFSRARVLCIGDLMVDRSFYGDVRISPEAPVPVVRIQRESSDLGGAGNVVRNVVALGGQCAVFSVIGDDAGGREATNLLAGLHGAEPYVRVSRERETTIKSRFFGYEGHYLLRADRETTVALGADDRADLQTAAESQMGDCSAVILSDYAKGVLGGGLAAAVIACARAQGKVVIVDPKGADYSRYRGASVITPNKSELAQATGLPVDSDAHVVTAARALMAATEAQAILVTRSAEGMSLVTADEVHHLPAELKNATDVTGAGDTVVATFTLALACGGSMLAAARLANVAAGIVVARPGTAVATARDVAAALLQAGLMGADEKVAQRADAVTQIQEWRRQGLKVGFTNGCFDLLHPGHVSLLRQARAACDRLVVALNSDASVRRLKGETRPVQTETARAAVMASLAPVDLVVIFSEDTPLALIEALRPDVLVKGADYKRADVVGGDFVESYGGRVVLAEVVPSHSTTATIAAMKTGHSAGR